MSFKTVLKIAGGLSIALILLGIVIAVIAPDAQTTNNTTASGKTALVVASAPAKPVIRTDVCNFDWTFQATQYIGNYNTAPVGSSYVIVNLYLKNNGDKSVSTNPYFWNFVADGIKYTSDVATYDSSIRHQTVEVGKGGEIETQMVYLVKGVPTEATLEFKGFSRPDFQKVKYYTPPSLEEVAESVTGNATTTNS